MEVKVPLSSSCKLFHLIFFLLSVASLFGASLGDLNSDGHLSRQDLQYLSEKLRSNENTNITIVDLDLNHNFELNDVQLLEHLLELQTRSPHSPLLSFFHCLLGQKAMDKNEMKNIIGAVPTISTQLRSSSLAVLLEYLSNDGGKRIPKPSEPGDKITFSPREVVFLLAGSLLNQEVTALAAGRKNEFGSLAFNDTQRKLSQTLDTLENLLNDSNLQNIQSQKWLQTLFQVTRKTLVAAAKKSTGNDKTPVASITINEPTKIVDSSSVIVQQVKEKNTKEKIKLWKWFLGLFLIGFAALFIAFLRRSKKRSLHRETPTVKAAKPKRPKSQVTATQPVAVSGLSHMLANKLPKRYRIAGELGKGGQAVVFLADDVTLNRRVAIKVIDETAFSGRAVSRFLREAETLASMSHQGIPKIYDLQQKPPFIVMEYIAGQNLWSILRNGRPDFLQGLQWTFELFSLLAHCHERNIFHRDIKPGNIVISEKGLHLIDFGLVKREDDTQITSQGKMLGTMSYFAPEQFRAAASNHRTELYSAGLVAYELLTGSYPFASQHPFPPQALQEPRTPRSLAADIHPVFDKFLLSLLEKSPKNRPETVADAYFQLEKITRKYLRHLPPILSSNNSIGNES